MNINFRQLVFAREFRGLSQSELASKIEGLSQPNLSKYEKGFNTLSEDMVFKIIEELGFPKNWLFQNVSNYSENANYRIKTTLLQRDKASIDFGNRLIGFIIDQLSDSVDWPEFKHVPIDIEHGYTPSQIARHARKVLGLKPGEPVHDVFTLLENRGIIVVEIKSHEKFDGVSFITDKGTPVIIINKDFANDRKRRTVVHEYGHILMHCYFPIPKHRDTKIKEEEVEEFTSEFLMPEDFIRNSLIRLKIGNLTELKRFWLTSMASIVRRAKDLKCITKEQYTYFNIELSRSGKKIDEGVYVSIDEPTLFNEAYKIHKQDLGYTDLDICEAFSLPIDVISKFCNQGSMLRIIHNQKKHL